MDSEQKEESRSGRRAGGKAASPMRFVFFFLGLLLAFELTWEFVISPGALFQSYLAFNARFAATILRIFEGDVSTTGNVITSSRYSLGIARGCDALQPLGIFLAAVLAFPAVWRSKAAPILIGSAVILCVNQLRIVSLYYMGIDHPTAFEVFHEAVWPAAFILLAFVMWILWVRRLMPARGPRP